MTRLEKLEAVAEAARSALHDAPGAHERLSAALDALDALPAQPQPQGETVTLAVWQNDDGNVWFGIIGSEWEYNVGNRDGRATRLGTVKLPITREGGR